MTNPDESFWKLSVTPPGGGAATIKSFADWGLSDLVRSRASGTADTVSFTAPVSVLEGPDSILPLSDISVFRGDTPWFRGRINSAPRTADVSGERVDYIAQGPWWFLEHLVYSQQWKVWNGSGFVWSGKSRVILGKTSAGARVRTGAAIRMVLDYAIARGAPFLVGTITSGPFAPVDEALDITCAEAVSRLLRWTPDAVAFFDYTTAPPTLHILRADELPVRSVSLEEMAPESFAITPRHDLLVPGVRLKYEYTDDSGEDGDIVNRLEEDVAGAPDSFGALEMTISLESAPGTPGQYVSVESEALPTDLYDSAFWMKYVPWLSQVSGLEILAPSADGQVALTRVLTSGSIPDWLNKNIGMRLFTCTVNGTIGTTAITSEKISLKLQCTDAMSRKYSYGGSGGFSEEKPVGLAAELFRSLGTLQHDGSFSVNDIEPGYESWLGSVLNFAWVDASCCVQKVTENVDRGVTTVEFGPAGHLAPQDLLEMLRANRIRRQASSASTGSTEPKTTDAGIGAVPSALPGNIGSALPSGGSQYQVLQRNGSGAAVWDYVRAH